MDFMDIINSTNAYINRRRAAIKLGNATRNISYYNHNFTNEEIRNYVQGIVPREYMVELWNGYLFLIRDNRIRCVFRICQSQAYILPDTKHKVTIPRNICTENDTDERNVRNL